ncbi:MAG: hypothetical protein ACT6FB_04520, partial [Methanosarcinaceae archaeon]
MNGIGSGPGRQPSGTFGSFINGEGGHHLVGAGGHAINGEGGHIKYGEGGHNFIGAGGHAINGEGGHIKYGEGGHNMCGAIQQIIGQVTALPTPTAAKALIILAFQRLWRGSPAYRSSSESRT